MGWRSTHERKLHVAAEASGRGSFLFSNSRKAIVRNHEREDRLGLVGRCDRSHGCCMDVSLRVGHGWLGYRHVGVRRCDGMLRVALGVRTTLRSHALYTFARDALRSCSCWSRFQCRSTTTPKSHRYDRVRDSVQTEGRHRWDVVRPLLNVPFVYESGCEEHSEGTLCDPNMTERLILHF